MTSGYKIVRVPGNMVDLERLVGNAMAEGWVPSGTPFFDRDSRQWCQAMMRAGEPAPAGQVKLREPRR